MSRRIDGWSLMARIAANREQFCACESTASLAATLLVRSQLVQGVTSQKDLLELAGVVGPEPMMEVIENLAGYEALRIVDRIGWPVSAEGERNTASARAWLVATLSAPQERAPSPPVAARKPAPPASGRALRGHRAMGARRLRPAS